MAYTTSSQRTNLAISFYIVNTSQNWNIFGLVGQSYYCQQYKQKYVGSVQI